MSIDNKFYNEDKKLEDRMNNSLGHNFMCYISKNWKIATLGVGLILGYAGYESGNDNLKAVGEFTTGISLLGIGYDKLKRKKE
jgi:hypothetical protein